MTLPGKYIAAFLLLLLAGVLSRAPAQVPAPPDSSAAGAKILPQPTVFVGFADTIPDDFFQIVDNLGLNSYTVRLVSRFENIPDNVILEALAKANSQIDYQRINAYTVSYALTLLCNADSLWKSFFADLEMQMREPNILRFNFLDNQKWKSYALNDLFYSTFFQELLLAMGNIGIAQSRDGKQWLDGWPDEVRWKFREYEFEYMPEDMQIRVRGVQRTSADTTTQTSTTVRLFPLKPVLPPESGDSTETPFRVPAP